MPAFLVCWQEWHLISFRSQKTSYLQEQDGMFLAMHGLTRSAQTAGRVLDFSTVWCLNDMFKQQQAKNHKEVVHKTMETACKVQQKKIEWTIKQ